MCTLTIWRRIQLPRDFIWLLSYIFTSSYCTSLSSIIYVLLSSPVVLLSTVPVLLSTALFLLSTTQTFLLTAFVLLSAAPSLYVYMYTAPLELTTAPVLSAASFLWSIEARVLLSFLFDVYSMYSMFQLCCLLPKSSRLPSPSSCLRSPTSAST
jgi:hypothetical protein